MKKRVNRTVQTRNRWIMAFAMEKRGEGRVVCLPAVFIDKYMYNADGNFVKVYIAGLRQCNLNKTLSNTTKVVNILL